MRESENPHHPEDWPGRFSEPAHEDLCTAGTSQHDGRRQGDEEQHMVLADYDVMDAFPKEA